MTPVRVARDCRRGRADENGVHHHEFLKLLLGGHVARLHDAGAISREEANQRWTSLAAADRDGTFLYGFTAFIVSGTKA